MKHRRRAGEPAEPDQRTLRIAREQVAGQREQVGREALMRGAGQADQPTASQMLLACAANITGSANNAQTNIARLRARPAATPRFQQTRRIPAAGDRAEIGEHVDRDQRRAEILEVVAVAAVEEVGQPEQEGPPHRIDQEPAGHIGPGLAMAQQRAQETGAADVLRGSASIQARSSALTPRMLARRAIEAPPRRQPDEVEQRR